MEEANECTAIRLTEKRQRAKVGDIFRLSPADDIFVWGRLIKRARFFGLSFELNLVYIYDAIGCKRPAPDALVPSNLILGPSVVNNLGFSRGYWEIVGSGPVTVNDMLDKHLFIRFKGTGKHDDYELVDEDGALVHAQLTPTSPLLAQSGIGNYNLIDWRLQEILRGRGVLSA
jgi:hypothetical protein